MIVLGRLLKWLALTKPCGCICTVPTGRSVRVSWDTETVTVDYGASIQVTEYNTAVYRCKECGDEFEKREKLRSRDVYWKDDTGSSDDSDDLDDVDAETAGQSTECRAVADDDSAVTADDSGGPG